MKASTVRERWSWRSTPVVGALIAVAVIASACGGGKTTATEAPVVGLTIFTSTVYGYSIGYPSGDSVEKATRSMSAVDLPAEGPNPALDRFLPEGAGPVIAVGARPEAAGTSVGDWTDAVTERVHSLTGGCSTPGAPESARVGGEPARIVTFPLCDGLFQVWALVLHGTSGYFIVFRDDPGTEKTDRPLDDRVLATFRFAS